MIRVYVTKDLIDRDGGFGLAIYGHANTMVCAGISAIVDTMVLGLKAVARTYPRECRFVGKEYLRGRKARR